MKNIYNKKRFEPPANRPRRALRNNAISIALGAMPATKTELESEVEKIEHRVLSAPLDEEDGILKELADHYIGLAGVDDAPTLDFPSLLEAAEAASDGDVGEKYSRCKLCGSAVESIHDHMRDDHKFLHPELYRRIFSLPDDYPLVCLSKLPQHFANIEAEMRNQHYNSRISDPDLYFPKIISKKVPEIVDICMPQIKYYMSIGRTVKDMADKIHELCDNEVDVKSLGRKLINGIPMKACV